MASLPHSTDNLDLTTLPTRLDDETLARVKALSNSGLPAPIPADGKHFNQCLRVLLAVLPKRSSDELSGELFVAAYQRKLGHLTNEAISFLADKAMERCHWFPTIAECLEIMEDYRRNDAPVHRINLARELARNEDRARRDEEQALRESRREVKEITQEEVDAMPDFLQGFGVTAGFLMKGEDGRVVPTPIERDEDGNIF